MEKRLNILLTTAWYPNRLEPGDGVFVQKHSRAIARMHQVSVMVVKPDSAVRFFHTEYHFDMDGDMLVLRVYVPKVKFSIPVLTQMLRLFLYCKGSWRGYRKIVSRRGEPDICHANVLSRCAFVPFVLSCTRHIPYIITEHWSRYSRGLYPYSPLQHLFTRKAVKRASFVAPVSVNLQKAMQAKGLYNDNYVIVNNVVDTDMFIPVKKPVSDIKRLVHVSWMKDDAKNITGILRVLARLRMQRQDFTLDLIGQGDDYKMIKDYVADIGLGDIVRFQGMKSGADLARSLALCDFFVLFSNYENQPVCVLEALSCGLPVVSTDVGSVAEMLDNQTRGVLVKRGDEEALLQKISFMLDNYLKYDSEELHKYIQRNYSFESVARAYSSLYERALCQKSR